MIWFTCTQCGKRHSRPDETAGSLVFCECGHGNRVPWESTAPAGETPGGARPRTEQSSARRRPALRRRDPTHCLNHEDAPSEKTCAACGETFCASCVINLQGETLCGPCKNYRIGRLVRPPHVSPLAIVALAVGMLSAPAAFFLSVVPLGTNADSLAAVLGCGASGLVLPLGAVVLGLLSLRQIESDPRVGGRALAMTGAAAGALGVLWCLTVVLLAAGRQFLE